MKKNKLILIMALMLFCINLTSIPTFASSDKNIITSTESVTADKPISTTQPISSDKTGTTDASTTIIETFTPDGNLTLVDDIQSQDEENKQFLTIQSKNGNYFYLVIDRTNNGQNVYFLNMVDESDLLALIDESPIENSLKCTCDKRCEKDTINTECPVCITDMQQCKGKYSEPEPTAEDTQTTDTKESTSSMPMGILAVVAILLVLGGGAIYYLKFMKPKNENKGNPNLYEYDFEDDEIILDDITDEETEEV